MPRIGNKNERNTRKQLLSDWDAFLLDSETINQLEMLTLVDFTDSSESLKGLLDSASMLWNVKPMTLENFSQLFNDASAVQAKHPTLVAAHKNFRGLFRAHKKRAASHWEKRQLVKQLGIMQPSFSIIELLKAGQNKFGEIVFVERKRNLKHKVKRYTRLSETEDPTALIVNENTGYYVLKEDESVIFYSFLDSAHEKIFIELAVIRGVGLNTPFSNLLFSWLADTATIACRERRNVRPTHPGKVVQVGINMGPRHARVLGWAKSYTKKLDEQVIIKHDLDAVGGLSIMWSLIQSVMPFEVRDEVNSCLAEVGLPRLATRNIEEGHGFHIKIGNTAYLFPTAERAPPEGYYLQSYEAWTHTDPAYCTYAFSLCTSRYTPTIQTQSFPGSSYVDVGLKVVVRQAQGTVMAFQPKHLHGTTAANGVKNTGMAITFSNRVSEAWKKAKELRGRVTIVSEAI